MAKSEVRLQWNGRQVTDAMRREARTRVTIASEHVRGQILETLSGSRGGRTYLVPGTSRTYTASAPGEPPASRLGRLRQSINSQVTEAGSKVEGDTGTDLDYGLFTERGTRNMAPRPWLVRTFERETPAIREIVEKTWTL